MKTINELNYKKLIYKKIIIKDVVNKLNELIKAVNKLSKNKIKIIKQEVKPRFQYPICPKCKSKDVKKGGKRHNLERGDTQRFYCNDCNYHFTPKIFEYRMRVSENKLKKAFELFNQGLSYSQIANKIKGVSRQTIGRWLKKYKIPKKDRIFEREMKSRWGINYKRKFNIKYKK